jgi:hypothetical protein
VADEKVSALIMLMGAVNAQAQFWSNFNYRGQWIRVRDIPSSSLTTRAWEVSGGVTTDELNYLGLTDMGDNQGDRGYFEFYGDGILNPQTGNVNVVLDWPPGMIDHSGQLPFQFLINSYLRQFPKTGFVVAIAPALLSIQCI